MALLLVVAAGAVLLATHLGVALVDRHRAQTAADAAALAGVVSGLDGARALSAANGGVLEHFRRSRDANGGVLTEVRVRVGGTTAEALAGLSDVPTADGEWGVP